MSEGATAGPFGGAARAVLRAGAVAGSADIAEAERRFRGLAGGGEPRLLLGSCRATAAFGRRDTLRPGYAAAEESVLRHGFEPVIRPVGGRLAVYDEGSVVVHLTVPQRQPGLHLHDRFRLFAAATAAALADLGVPDVRVGAVPGEYCEGEWSVNTGGAAKLVGTGQRVNQHGFLFSAVVTVSGPDRLATALTDAYAALGVDFDPRSVGSVDTWAPGVTPGDVIAALVPRLEAL